MTLFRAPLVMAALALALIGASNALDVLPPRMLSPLFVLVFVWLGSHERRGRSLYLAPVAAGIYTSSVLAADHGVPLDAATVVLVTVVCSLVAETVARKQERLRASEAEMRFLVEHSTDMVTRIGPDAVVRYTAPSIERILGWKPEDIVGVNTVDLRHPEDPDPVALAFGSPGEAFTVERRLLRADGGYAWLESVAQAVPGPDGKLEVLISARDISRRREVEAELQRVATHDPLTGLPNRVLLDTHLQQALSRQPLPPFVVAFLDLDGFKAVNDRHGHQVGDRLLVQVGRRLLAITRDCDLVARYGGDEFVLVVEGIGAGVEMLGLAHRIETELAAPYRMGTLTLTIGASVGVVAARPGSTPAELVAEADQFMYVTKAARRERATAPQPRASSETLS